MSTRTDFMVEEGFYSLTPEQKALICNGAGAAGDWRSAFIPNTLYGLDCTEVFGIHDYAYHVGVTQRDKDAADIAMLVNLIKHISKGSVWLQFVRNMRAMKYYTAVQVYGDGAFFTEVKGNLDPQRESDVN